MARKELFLKAGSTFYTDPATVTKEVKKASWFRYILVRLLIQMGVPVVDPCCPQSDNVPVSWNTQTSTLQAWIDGAWVDVNTAASGSTTIPPTTTTVAPTTTTIPPTTTTTIQE